MNKLYDLKFISSSEMKMTHFGRTLILALCTS